MLISIFILLFGLLAVAAMIPVAGLRIMQTVHLDNAAACGQAGLRDVKVRRIHDPRNWLRWKTSPPGFVSVVGGNRKIRYDLSFAIDPLGFANSGSYSDTAIADLYAWFPYIDPNDSVPNLIPNRMRRVTLTESAGTVMRQRLADRIFTWRDDLAIPVPDDDAVRPDPIMIQDGSGNDLAPQVWGDYSWMVTVTPAPNLKAPGGGMYKINNHRNYLVSVVVFHKRDFSPPNDPADPDLPGERFVYFRTLSDGYGGGDVRLGRTRDPAAPAEDNVAAKYLDVREGDWLMLCGADTTTNPWRDYFRWYRVVNTSDTYGFKDDNKEEDVDGDGKPDNVYEDAGDWDGKLDTVDEDANGNDIFDPGEDLDGDNHFDRGNEDVDGDGNLDVDEDFNDNGTFDEFWFREVTLAGPDWPGTIVDGRAVLCPRVIGVYTTIMELDGLNSLWAKAVAYEAIPLP